MSHRPNWSLSAMIALLFIWSATTGAADEKQWVYRQKTGELLLGSELVGKGYSGHEEGLNKPEKEAVRDLGPIPAGRWSIGAAFKHETKGPVVMRLSPEGHKAHGRDGFLIHGDNSDQKMTASNGCIVLSRPLREKIAKSGVKKLLVVKE